MGTFRNLPTYNTYRNVLLKAFNGKDSPKFPFKLSRPQQSPGSRAAGQPTLTQNYVNPDCRRIIEEVHNKTLEDMREEAEYMSPDDMELTERSDIRSVLNALIHGTFFKEFEDAPSAAEKLKVMRIKLNEIFEIMRIIMRIYRGGKS